ncbi:hypothetical protein KALB_3857 [Kutzneria albida DSM 43870]|uniref:HTH arsR-type domain-containing protein n=1 Tax=Kutzneria albida DSM 43870 TaxID=1449976 RepID=W5W9L5_9PSEU|nr:hypothetical protein KALB_3857 [Kutzneria albida DSM 43870]
MLTVHFGPEDLGRTRVAAAPDPIGETLFSLQVLHSKSAHAPFRHWRARARELLAAMPDAPLVRLLLPLCTAAGLLSAIGRGQDVEHAALMLTGMSPATAHLVLREHRPPPSLLRALGDGDSAPLERMAQALRDYHAHAVQAHWSTVAARVDLDRAVRARTLLNAGLDGLMATLSPDLDWRHPVLGIEGGADREVHLSGNGLVLLPVVFGPPVPLLVVDTGRAPVLLYPVDRGPDWLLCGPRPAVARGGRSLTHLLGRTRATLLLLAREGASTGELARLAAISESSASEHVSVLRAAGLLSTSRRGRTSLHGLTPIGAALLRANPTAPAHFGPDRKVAQAESGPGQGRR